MVNIMSSSFKNKGGRSGGETLLASPRSIESENSTQQTIEDQVSSTALERSVTISILGALSVVAGPTPASASASI